MRKNKRVNKFTNFGIQTISLRVHYLTEFSESKDRP